MSIRFFGDALRQVSTSVGTGNVTLGAAPTGDFVISSVFADSVDFPYVIDGIDGSGNRTGQKEVGKGHLTASGTQLVRATVTRSSNANALVNFTSASLRVYVALTAAGIEEWRPPQVDSYTPTNGQTVFTLSAAPSVPQARVGLFVNGRKQRPGTDYTLSGVTLTWLNTGFTLATTDYVEVTY